MKIGPATRLQAALIAADTQGMSKRDVVALYDGDRRIAADLWQRAIHAEMAYLAKDGRIYTTATF